MMDKDSDRPAQQVPEKFAKIVDNSFQPKRAETVCNKGGGEIAEGAITPEMIGAGIAECGIRQSADVVAFPFAQPKDDQGQDVERVNHYPLYELGKTLRQFEEATGDFGSFPLRRMYHPLRASISALENLLAGVPFPLGISKTAAATLKELMQRELEHRFVVTDNNGRRVTKLPEADVIIDSWQLLHITTSLSKFETIFSTEMGELATYFVPQRGIYSTAALIDFADQSFPAEIFGHVPEKAKEDWKAAGRCLAFSLLSASGFHVARAVEATLEVYYQTFTGKSGTLNSWYDYIKALNGVLASGASPAPTEKTLAELTQMKDDYRNPVMHPRVTLTEIEARMLFDNGESAIIGMAAEIKTVRETGGVQQSLAVVGGRDDLDDEIPF